MADPCNLLGVAGNLGAIEPDPVDGGANANGVPANGQVPGQGENNPPNPDAPNPIIPVVQNLVDDAARNVVDPALRNVVNPLGLPVLNPFAPAPAVAGFGRLGWGRPGSPVAITSTAGVNMQNVLRNNPRSPFAGMSQYSTQQALPGGYYYPTFPTQKVEIVNADNLHVWKP